MKFKNYLNEMPETWTKDSIEKMGKTIGKSPADHGFFDACVVHMKGNVSDPQAFCANLIDEYKNNKDWRKGKK